MVELRPCEFTVPWCLPVPAVAQRLASAVCRSAFVLAVEVRDVIVTDAESGFGGVDILVEHQAPGFLKTQLLLELQRAHRRHRFKMDVKP